LTYKCPICVTDFEATAIRRPSGISGPSYCPNCQGRVRVVLPNSKYAAIIALLIAWVVLALLGVRSVFGVVIGTVLIWIPLSLYLNAVSFRYKSPVLKKWEPRRERRFRSFFEWLYERDQIRAPELPDEDKKKDS